MRIERVDGDAAIADWRFVHNEIVPPAALSVDEVRERTGRNHLFVAYAGDVLVGCSTVRPPADGTATVIARVLPDHRRQGFGQRLYEHGLAIAREIGAEGIETVVLGSNVSGLDFALGRGFSEIERYTLPGETELWITLGLNSGDDAAV